MLSLVYSVGTLSLSSFELSSFDQIAMIRPFLIQTRRFASKPSLAFLAELGISTTKPNHGVYHGEWAANGKVVDSINPATNEKIASTITGTVDDYEIAIKKMEIAKIGKDLITNRRTSVNQSMDGV